MDETKFRAYKPQPEDPPAMTSASAIPPLEERRRMPLPPELGEDIVARPLIAPDFIMDIKKYMVNPNLWPRWIFTDRRRYSQALSQGWRPAKATDFKPGFAKLSPYSEEGGTKFINGDLILMLIDRRAYLGALRHNHDIAMGFTDANMAKRMSAKKAEDAMGPQVNALNKWLERQGKRPAMEVFDPHDEMADLKGAPDSRIGEGPRDMGKLADLETKE